MAPDAALTGSGIAELEAWLVDWARAAVVRGEPALVTHARQAHLLQTCLRFLQEAAAEPDPVLHAEGLRGAATSLGRLTGRIDPETVLGAIFSRFCIGK
jgi:tRNA modification GTPase